MTEDKDQVSPKYKRHTTEDKLKLWFAFVVVYLLDRSIFPEFVIRSHWPFSLFIIETIECKEGTGK